ncbi:NAD(P)-dependent oxidoreductase [Leifsonia kafniensis]|uniref:NAD(P)-dependent oxidoreductase n=1 Tax=Leifsonia kafniensis TaxID=475957 RepID=A0ABP7KP42_9MICO
MTAITPATIGFIGLGNMGTPMASRLIAAGHTVIGFDLAESARARLTEAGGRAVGSPTEAIAGVDVLILMLPNSAIVEDVILAPEALKALSSTTVIVDMSSSEPLRTRALAEKLVETQGAVLLDGPVSGGVTGAVNGTLTIMVGGGINPVESVTPILSILGKVVHAGDTGAGHALKALNNLLSATHLLVTSEAILAGERFGLDPKVMLGAINNSSGRSGSTENKWPNFILPETYNSGFGLRLMLKDMKIATDLCAQLGMPSLLGQHAVELWDRAAAALPATADHTEIARWLKENGE